MNAERLTAAAGGLSAMALGLLLLLFLIPNYVTEPATLAPNAPGPRAIPTMIAWSLVILGAFETVTTFMSGERIRWKRPDGLGRLFLVGGIILVTLLLTPYVGMIPAGIVMMVAVTTGASGQRLVPSVLTALLFGGALYLVFVLLAGIPVPGGSLWG